MCSSLSFSLSSNQENIAPRAIVMMIWIRMVAGIMIRIMMIIIIMMMKVDVDDG